MISALMIGVQGVLGVLLVNRLNVGTQMLGPEPLVRTFSPKTMD